MNYNFQLMLEDRAKETHHLNPLYIPLTICPLELRDANALVSRLHRHHKKVTGHRFSIGVRDDTGLLRGAAIVGRPVARLTDATTTLEVTRLVTDGTPNACSMLYGAAARIGRELGYQRIQTFILHGDEDGISLRASGWAFEKVSHGGQWTHSDGKERRTDQPTGPKERWSRALKSEKLKPCEPLIWCLDPTLIWAAVF